MDPNSQAKHALRRPPFVRQRELHFGCRSDGVASPREDEEDAVPRPIDLIPVQSCGGTANDLTHTGAGRRELLAEGVEELRRALDVRKQHGHSPTRQITARPSPYPHETSLGASIRYVYVPNGTRFQVRVIAWSATRQVSARCDEAHSRAGMRKTNTCGCAKTLRPRRDLALDLHLVFPDGILGSDLDLLDLEPAAGLARPFCLLPGVAGSVLQRAAVAVKLLRLVTHRSTPFVVSPYATVTRRAMESHCLGNCAWVDRERSGRRWYAREASYLARAARSRHTLRRLVSLVESLR